MTCCKNQVLSTEAMKEKRLKPTWLNYLYLSNQMTYQSGHIGYNLFFKPIIRSFQGSFAGVPDTEKVGRDMGVTKGPYLLTTGAHKSPNYKFIVVVRGEWKLFR